MQHTELLHRFFDEGLEESLEDVLFEQMATDAELRGEFLEHLRLHSIIQEDAAGVTTPSHVSQELFLNLGLTPPEHVDTAAPPGLRKRVAALALGMRSFVVQHQRYFYTAALSSLATLLLIFGLNVGTEPSSADEDGSVNTQPGSEIQSTQATQSPGTGEHTGAGNMNDVVAAERDHRSTNDASQAERRSSIASRTGRSAAGQGGSGTVHAGSFASSSVPARQHPASIMRESREHDDNLAAADATDEASRAHTTAVSSADALDLVHARAIALNDVPMALPEERVTERRWHFFQPGPRTNLLSNMVFELQKLVGTSYPNVDLPHNSHKVFENMALSAVYKVTEHHAFGFEYGREQFGREYTSTVVPLQAPLDVSVQEMFTPPASAMTVQTRDNRMLDIFGAVWKLSLPDYGIAHIVYPYMRTFVGATRIGPLGKVRLGLEMYPSNFSALNVGLEGGVFRYTEDDAAYYTTKLNLTLGVAIGF